MLLKANTINNSQHSTVTSFAIKSKTLTVTDKNNVKSKSNTTSSKNHTTINSDLLYKYNNLHNHYQNIYLKKPVQIWTVLKLINFTAKQSQTKTDSNSTNTKVWKWGTIRFVLVFLMDSNWSKVKVSVKEMNSHWTPIPMDPLLTLKLHTRALSLVVLLDDEKQLAMVKFNLSFILINVN